MTARTARGSLLSSLPSIETYLQSQKQNFVGMLTQISLEVLVFPMDKDTRYKTSVPILHPRKACFITESPRSSAESIELDASQCILDMYLRDLHMEMSENL